MRELVVGIILVMSGLDLVFMYLTLQSMKQPLDPAVADIYAPEDYARFIRYTGEKTRLSLITKAINLSVSLFFFIGLAARLDVWALSLGLPFPFADVAFVVVYLALVQAINWPLNLYNTFSIEKRYGFSTISVQTYLIDRVKSLVLAVLLGLPLISGLLFVIGTYPDQFVWVVLVALLSLSLIMQVIYVPILIPIFNKVSALEPGPLKDRLEALAKSANYEVSKVSLINASKRSKRLNAFFTGFGRFKHIILFDTLRENLNDDEIASILAHEIGHAKHKDVLRFFALSAVSLTITLLVLQWVLSFNGLASAFGVSETNLAFKVLVFFTLYAPVNLLEGLFSSQLSQSFEYKADAMMAKLGLKDAAISAFKVLARVNFTNLNPHPLVVKLSYSHPPIKERILALQKLN